MKEAKVIAHSVICLDTTACFVGYVYASVHGYELTSYWLLFGAIIQSFFMRQIVGAIVSAYEE